MQGKFGLDHYRIEANLPKTWMSPHISKNDLHLHLIFITLHFWIPHLNDSWCDNEYDSIDFGSEPKFHRVKIIYHRLSFIAVYQASPPWSRRTATLPKNQFEANARTDWKILPPEYYQKQKTNSKEKELSIE